MISDIPRPTLMIDEKRVRANIEIMSIKARDGGVRLRPHFKTHQSAAIGEWFKDYGIHAITVSSVSMAAYFADNDWSDITIAFPTNIREINLINELAEKIKLGLLVESIESVRFLNKNLLHAGYLWIKIDVGTHRTGIAGDDLRAIDDIVREVSQSERIQLRGLLSHAGHSYSARRKDQIQGIYSDSENLLHRIRSEFANQGLEISVGDTPSCSLVKDFGQVDEIRPGNFVFYDVMQLRIGSCDERQIAVAMACPVVAKHPNRNEIVIYGGAVHFSKDFIEEDGHACYGLICLPEEKGWGRIVDKAYLSRVSQEHGIIKAEGEFVEAVNIGDILLILPVHSCLTADLMGEYLALDGSRIEMMRKFYS